VDETPQESVLEREVRFIDPQDVTIWRDRFGQLRLKLADGREYRDVHLTLAFPVSHATQMLVVRDADLAEIGVIDDYLSVDEQSRQVVTEELKKAYFVPRIERILGVREQRGVVTFELVTDRGPRTIEVPQTHSRRRALTTAVVALPGGRVIIHDADANRYDIPSLDDLDPRSRALLDEYL
jgi:hypothetical protein